MFEACHARILALVHDGAVEGLRVDHVDGLRDPQTYLERLRARAPGTWIAVEKILTSDEVLPAAWPIEGTTGYEVAERLGGLLVDPAGRGRAHRGVRGAHRHRRAPVRESRRARHAVLVEALHSELARLTELAVRACAASPACRDYTRAEIEAALGEILAGFPVYRTYLREDRRSEVDCARITAAVAAARDARPTIDLDLLAFFEAALAFELPGAEAVELARATQQVTGAITAKGDEDTLLYRQVRFASRCEVGADLARFAHAPAAVHRALAAGRPRSLLATATHDTKRSEDVRARIAVLSEVPARWATAVAGWNARAAHGWGEVAPDRVLAYLMWQTLVGAWPLPLERARGYAHKAAKEARLRTSWRHPDAAYEAALDRWLEPIYDDTDLLADVARFAAELTPYGDRNALAQLGIKLVAPGVPDFYQGSELRDDSLVDPDNRRDVDLVGRRERVRWIADATAASVTDTADLRHDEAVRDPPHPRPARPPPRAVRRGLPRARRGRSARPPRVRVRPGRRARRGRTAPVGRRRRLARDHARAAAGHVARPPRKSHVVRRLAPGRRAVARLPYRAARPRLVPWGQANCPTSGARAPRPRWSGRRERAPRRTSWTSSRRTLSGGGPGGGTQSTGGGRSTGGMAFR